MEKLQKAYRNTSAVGSKLPIASKPGTARIVVGNWTLSCTKTDELTVKNCEGQQVGEVVKIMSFH